MAKGNGQGIRSVQILGVYVYAQGLFDHHGDLILGRKAVAAYRYLRLARGIFVDGYAFPHRRDYGCTLGTAEFEHHLGILTHEGRLDGKRIRVIFGDQFLNSGIDIYQLLVRIPQLSQVEYAHCHIMRPAPFNTDNPVTKNVGSGVDSEYGAVLNQ